MNSDNKINDTLKQIVEIIKEEAIIDSKYIAPRPPGPKSAADEPILYSDELSYLNHHWNDWVSETPYTSHRGFLGKVIVKIKRKLQKYFFEVFFRDYFERERIFTCNLVRFMNLTAHYIDKRHEETFYTLIKKIDNEANLINSRNDELFAELIKRINHSNAK